MAQWLSWLERRPVTAEVEGSSPFWVVSMKMEQKVHGIIAQLGEHLPYKQGVTGSSPVGPIKCRRGGTGRRTGLKILRDLPPVPVRFRSPALIVLKTISAFIFEYVGLAQLDRAFGYGPKGRGFESSIPH